MCSAEEVVMLRTACDWRRGLNLAVQQVRELLVIVDDTVMQESPNNWGTRMLQQMMIRHPMFEYQWSWQESLQLKKYAQPPIYIYPQYIRLDEWQRLSFPWW
jgi:glucan phosphorylase